MRQPWRFFPTTTLGAGLWKCGHLYRGSAFDCFRCIPEAWVNDDWPDCFDGSDEEGETGATKDATLPQQLVCIQVRLSVDFKIFSLEDWRNSLYFQCAGVVLSAGFICRETSELTRDCLETTMGKGGACNQCVDMYLNLPWTLSFNSPLKVSHKAWNACSLTISKVLLFFDCESNVWNEY